MQKSPQVHKMALYSIVLNSIQIVTVAAMCFLVFFQTNLRVSPQFLRTILVTAMLVVTYGAVMDIRDASQAMRALSKADMLVEAYGRMEELNCTLRAQRHDFMNHLQVVYSLMEMQEFDEAGRYIEKVYEDIVSVNKVMRTKSPAVNALLQAKMGDCARRGIQMRLDIRSAWAELPVPGWEMCRVLGNLIDNGMEAMEGQADAELRVSLWEDVRQYGFRVANNGPRIAEKTLEKMLQPGFTTKETGQGMGMYIVNDLVCGCGGALRIASTEEETSFEVTLPRKLDGISVGQDLEGSVMEIQNK